MKPQTPLACALVCSLLLTSCATNGGPSDNQTKGAVFGCLLGMAIGIAVMKDKAAGAAIGCAGGGVAGVAVGSYLDERERRQLAEATLRAASAPKDEKILWGDAFEPVAAAMPVAAASPVQDQPKNNKKSAKKASPPPTQAPAPPPTVAASKNPNSADGWVIPATETFVTPDGKECREIERHAEKAGKNYNDKVRVCKLNGTWTLPS